MVMLDAGSPAAADQAVLVDGNARDVDYSSDALLQSSVSCHNHAGRIAGRRTLVSSENCIVMAIEFAGRDSGGASESEVKRSGDCG